MNNSYKFIGGNSGKWKVISMNAICGLPLEKVTFIDIVQSSENINSNGIWTLTGFTSNTRYTEKEEREKLTVIQSGLGRAGANHAALIPIKKSESWWGMAQDERRKIFESKSHHIETGLKFLPAIARQLYHCRDIGEPFDFLTWFEYGAQDSDKFEELVIDLRKTEEWKYVEREIDLRLIKL